MRVYLDLDGVLCDFFSAACRMHNKDPIAELKTWPRGKWEMEEVWGLTKEAFWKPINDYGTEFWSRLDPYPYAKSVVETSLMIGKVVFATTPNKDASSLEGKFEWITKHFGKSAAYAMCTNKAEDVNAGGILVDDKGSTIRAYEERGGVGILVPRVWNNLHPYVDSPNFNIEAFIVGELIKYGR